MEMKNEVIYIGNIGCANTALSIHAQNIAKLFSKIGFHTTMICSSDRNTVKIDDNDICHYIYTKKYIKIPILRGVEWLFDSIFGWKHIHQFKKIVTTINPKIVIFYEYAGQRKIRKICNKYNITLIVERVDWFEKSDSTRFIDKYILQNLKNKILTKEDKNVDGVISISKFFDNYYKKMNVPSIFLPPIFELNKDYNIVKHKDDAPLKLVYAGSLGGKKDSILPVLNAIRKINETTNYIYFDIIGPSKSDVENETGFNDWLNKGVNIHGRLSNDKTKEIISSSDFSVLIRENKRYAKAGFSTKFAESMSLGVPVICSAVGGADAFLTDMHDGVLLPNNDCHTITNTLYTLLKLNSSEINQLKYNAFILANKLFNIENYQNNMRDFLQEIGGNHE